MSDRSPTPGGSEIREGDLVIQLRGCCLHTKAGAISIVKRLFMAGANPCDHCGASYTGQPAAALDDCEDHYYVLVSWLRRIPPLSELGDVETKETIDA